MDKQEKYIDVKEVISSKSRSLARWMPGFVLNYIKRILHEDEINGIMSRIGHLHGLEFVEAALKELHTEVLIKGVGNIPEKGGCILAANHPLGGLDGIVFMYAVGTVRPDMKFLVNDILLNIKNFQPLFLPVNKHGKNPRLASRLIEEAYSSDEAILVFPAGLVSRKQHGGVADLEWKKSFIAKAVKYQKNVIPTYIDGKNSPFFYNLSRLRTKLGVKANLEMFYLADEMFRQQNKTITITFGNSIPYTNFDSSKSQREWASYVRDKVYSLAR